MSHRAEGSIVRKAAVVLVLALAAAVLVPAALAQSSDETTPKVELFTGYAWMKPGGTVWGGFGGAAEELDNMNLGFGISFTGNVTEHWGITLDGGGHFGGNATAATIMVGPQYKWRGNVSPFVHFLVGEHILWPDHASSSNGFGLAAGGGLDIRLSRRVDFRLIEADYVYGHHNSTTKTDLNGIRLRTGLLFKFGGGPPPPPPSCSVSVEPMEGMAGEPLHATASTANFAQGRTLTYAWSSTGGTISGTDAAASVDTAGLAPGSYNVSVQVSDGRKGMANCAGAFTVKAPPQNPPQISCSANPATVRSGEASVISCTCTSPDNRSLSYSWNTNAGTLSGSGASETLDTAGLPSGPVSVGTTCTDDRGLSDATTTMVTVEAPPAAPEASKLGECAFTAARVDNACKAVLDDVALRLQRDADSKAVIIGYSGTGERKGVAAQRARNAKAYLVKEKGIDGSRIELRTGMGDERKAEFYIVPAGATFSDANTEMVME